VVAEEATTTVARDGQQLVGVVALDGELGSTPPGSPAVDETGAVVGLTTATADAAVAVVPIELASTVADELISSGSADHPRLGVSFTDDSAVAGALVAKVHDDGPAASGGVLPGDVVIELAGVEVDSMAKTIATLRTHRPGEVIEVIVHRDGIPVECHVKLGADI
jgi:putative serine protease PepD